jgi:hypothetical protein
MIDDREDQAAFRKFKEPGDSSANLQSSIIDMTGHYQDLFQPIK